MAICKNCHKEVIEITSDNFFCSVDCMLEYETGNKNGKLYR